MGCQKLNIDFFNALEVIHPKKRVSEEKKRINYYPFGLKHKGYNNVINGTDHKYGFGGKEEQDELDLNWLDFSWRNYDASLGRWMNIDPLAELAWTHSPYTFVYNSPLYYIDPDGLMGISPGTIVNVVDSVNQLMQDDFDDLFDDGVLLDEVVILVPKKEEVNDFQLYGNNRFGDMQGRKGPSSHSIDTNEFVSGSRGVSRLSNLALEIIKFMTKLFIQQQNVQEAVELIEPNETTMENKNVEPVEPPEPVILNPSMYVLVMYEDGKMDYVKNVGFLDNNRRTSAIDSAKVILEKYPELDSIKAKPWFYRGLKGTEVKKEKDTTIIRN